VDKQVYYFAYGSNLSTKRLTKRLPTAKCVGVAELMGYSLTFAMLSTDGSAKCDIQSDPSNEAMVLGVIYQLSEQELSQLDSIEGARYDRIAMSVQLKNGQSTMAFCYIANTHHTGVLPFCWYKQHVLNGANEHDFPKEYVNLIDMQLCTQDLDLGREQRELEIYK